MAAVLFSTLPPGLILPCGQRPTPALLAPLPSLLAPAQRSGAAQRCRMLSQAPGFWGRLLFGRSGAPPPPARCEESGSCTIRDLRPVFEQWDSDQSGTLELDELRRGFLAAGIEPRDWDAAFGALDADGDMHITFEEFEAGLGPEQRARIEAKLNADGVMASLYVPPEKWEEARTAAERQREEWLQFQARREGNGVKQNEILRREMNRP